MKRHSHHFSILPFHFHWGFLGLLVILFFHTSCQREISGEVNNNPGTGGGNPPAATIITTIKLMVLDENGMMRANAKVQCGTVTVYTDQFGIAEFKDIRVPADKALVKVMVPGYFEAYRTFPATTKECYGRVKLTKLGLANVMMTDTGGDIPVTSDCTIQFPANAFVVKSDGSPYTGAAVIYAQYLQPEMTDFDILMPGDLVAEDNGNQVLKSFGMVNVEILGTGNVPLQLKNGVQATIKAVIPSSLQASAPATIPMWYFDTNKGVWLKEGTATKQGNQYSGKVSHFTWWNYDWAYPRVFISGTLKDVNGLPMQGVVRMSVQNINVSLTASINQDGYFRIAAPLQSAISLMMTGASCNIPFYAQNLTTGNTDIDLGLLTCPALVNGSYQLNGTFNNCGNTAVSNGRMRVFISNNMYETRITNGNAAIAFNFCRDSVDALILAEDFSSGRIFTISKRLYNNTALNIGQQQICTAMATKYIRYIVDDQFYYIAGNAVDSLTSHYFSFGLPWAQVAHNSYANPLQLTSDIYFNTEMGGYVTTMMIKAYPNLSNMGFDRELSNTFENFSNTPGAINRGTVIGRQFDTGVNRWRYISVAYSVGHQ